MADTPTPGRIVMYHELADHQAWPAIVMQSRESEYGMPYEGENGTVQPTQTEIQLHVFRPRAAHDTWATKCPQGERQWGTWFWPKKEEPTS